MAIAPKQLSLTDLEWSVVSLALKDATRCGCATSEHTGVIGRVAKSLFGVRKPNRLADPKLEAVRHFVCVSRRRGQVTDNDVVALAEHGFSPAQIDALVLFSI